MDKPNDTIRHRLSVYLPINFIKLLEKYTKEQGTHEMWEWDYPKGKSLSCVVHDLIDPSKIEGKIKRGKMETSLILIKNYYN